MTKFCRLWLISITCVMMVLYLAIETNDFYYIGVNAENNDCKAFCLMDYNTGKIIQEDNGDKLLPIASVTKTMTLLLIFEALDKNQINIDDYVTASENAAGMGGSQVFIDANASYCIKDLITAIVVSSANDASVAMAEAVSGSEKSFVETMNNRAKELGMDNTHYFNCTGLPAPEHYSTANDVAVLMKQLLKHNEYYDYTKIWMQDFVHPSGRVTQMSNTNKLLRTYPNCDAGKTGSTSEAGYCLVASAIKNNTRLIGVILGADNSKNRFDKCRELFDWGFANYETKQLINKEEIIKASVKNASEKEVAVNCIDDYYVLNKKSESNSYIVEYEYSTIKAPIIKGQVVGQAIIKQNNEIIDSIDLIASEDVDKITYYNIVKDILHNWKIK